nr:unnamed protein product [Spirometra erinaceieuropaei]
MGLKRFYSETRPLLREQTGNLPTPLLSLNFPCPFRTSLLEGTYEIIPYYTKVATSLTPPASSNAPRRSSDGGSKYGFV